MKVQKINVQLPHNAQDECKIDGIEPFRETNLQIIIYYLLCLFSGGIFYLLSRWYLKIWVQVRLRPCDVESANYFLITAIDKTLTLEPASKQMMHLQDTKRLFIIFEYRFYKFYFDETINTFIALELSLSTYQNKEVLAQFHQGILSQDQLGELRNKFGSNSTAIPDKGIGAVLIEEVLSPFYIFSIFSITLWYFENYFKYATIILILSVLSIAQSLYEYIENFRKLQAIAKSESQVKVYRFCNGLTFIQNGKVEINEDLLKSMSYTNINSNSLVPGDVVQIEDNQTMTCDLILLTGQSVMNESMLTGESIPVIKTALPFNQFLYNSAEEGKQSTLFSGTICIETKIAGKGRIPVLAVATQTGFNTLKGQLIRSIMFTASNSFKFYEDAMKFLIVLAFLSIVGFFITLKSKIDAINTLGFQAGQIVISCLDLVTITVPPALPTSLQVGISIALYRLKKKLIFCISPFKINAAGMITVMCFDKTGTLTEDCLDMYGVIKIGFNESDQKLGFQISTIDSPQLTDINGKEQLIDDIAVNDYQNGVYNKLVQSATVLMNQTMASCHGLTILQGSLIGDPLDVKVFEQTKWYIQDEEEQGFQQIILPPKQQDNLDSQPVGEMGLRLEVIRKFEFQSKLQRMSVVVGTSSGIRIFCKGSPEKIKDLCIPQTIPEKYLQVLEYYAQNGYRVIACAARILSCDLLEIQTMERTEVECQLTFLGFIILENKLKPITISVIKHLQSADLRTIMITGDNILTAISVAKSCNIIQKDKRVYFGELQKDSTTQTPVIVWQDFTTSPSEGQTLNLQSPEKRAQDNVEFSKIVNDQDMDNQIQLTMLNRRQQIRESEQIPIIARNLEIIGSVKVQPWHDVKCDDYVLALTGAAFSFLVEKESQNPIYTTVLDKAQVYARMSPDEKGNLIKQLQSRLPDQPLVGFCGDGANDCAALKSADVGISISLAEASIAAPFTSQIQDISCVPILLCEGRAALTTSFTCFKFMIMYSILQFTTVCILYLSYSNLNNAEFLFIDLVSVLPAAMTMGMTHAMESLGKQVPKGSLMTFPIICSLIGQAIIQISFQMIVYAIELQQYWFVPAMDLYPRDSDELDESMLVSYETTSLFMFANLQYVFVVLAFQTGQSFCRPFYTNIVFTSICVCLFLFDYSLMIFFNDDNPFYKLMGLIFTSSTTHMPQRWIIFIALMSVLNGLVTVFYERVVVTQLSNYYYSRKQSLNKGIS